MPSTRRAKKRPRHANTDGLERNAGRRPDPKDPDQAAIDRSVTRVIVSGFRHPLEAQPMDILLGTNDIIFRLAVPRDGQMNDLSIFSEQVIDGPAYAAVFDQAGQMKDVDGKLVEWELRNNDVAPGPKFKVTTGQRIRFIVRNVKDFTDVRPEDIPGLTGSSTLEVIGAWLSGVYFAKGGGNVVASGTKSTRALPAGP